MNIAKNDIVFLHKKRTARELDKLEEYWHKDFSLQLLKYMVAQCLAFAVGLTLNKAYAVA
ncbi:hypothetical protein DSL72_009526 [Monilinia vaccinii-corymbosi]|uniref:Uncharacterized protein n=1 Tax=Monilinia vaccinii-corymbosi TaxID=61207 RepID=A0A8A3PPQ6_9HELO|nr:hypothetical protein DSL72_009526 [Monilinia vaccinii-corymbosi]